MKLSQLCAGVCWRYKGAGLKAGTGFTKGAVKPDSQGSRHFQAIHRFFVLGAELVSGLVSLDAEDMEQLFDLRFQPQFTVQAVQKFGLAGLAIKFYTRERSQVLGQGFAKLTEFDQGGVGVTGEGTFGGFGQFHE